MRKIFLLVSLIFVYFCLPTYAQTPAQAWGVLDFSACPNGTAPTSGNMGSSLFGTFYSGTSWSIVNGGSTFQCSTGNIVPWQTTPTLSGVSWPNSSTTSVLYSFNATSNQAVTMTTASSPNLSLATSASACQQVQMNIPQTAASWGRSDGLGLYTDGGNSNFILLEPQGNGTHIIWDMESPGAFGPGGGGTTVPVNNILPSNTQFTICEQNNSVGHKYIGIWNANGTYLSGSLASAPSPSGGGGPIYAIQSAGVGGGAQPIPSGTSMVFGSILFEGVGEAPSNSEFPLALGLQLLPIVDIVSSSSGVVNVPGTQTGCGSNFLVSWVSGATFNSGWTQIYIPALGYYPITSVLSTTSLCVTASLNGIANNLTGTAYTAGGGGNYSSTQTINLAPINTDSPNIGTIVYTLDGSTPTCANGSPTHGTSYSGSFTISASTTIKEMQCLTLGGGVAAYMNSSVTTSAYTIIGNGVLAPARSIAWTPGAVPSAPGTFPDATGWTQCATSACLTVCPGATTPCGAGGTVTVASLNAALASASAQQFVVYPHGTYTGLSCPVVLSVNQTALRGDSASSLGDLVCASTSGCTQGNCGISMNGSNNFPNGEQNHATWTAGFAQGATAVTVSNSLNIVAGKTVLNLDQQDYANDTGNIWPCATATKCGGFTNSGGAARTDNTCSSSVSPNVGHCTQIQSVEVTACSPSCNNSGSTVLTITPALAASNWTSSQSTGAWWATTDLYQVGVENTEVNMSAITGSGFEIANCLQCWVENWEVVSPSRNAVGIMFSDQETAGFGYAYQTTNHATSSYGIEVYGSSDVLSFANICQQTVSCFTTTGGGVDDVDWYSYSTDSSSSGAGDFTAMDFDHAGGDMYSLHEGSINNGFVADDIHGTHHFTTIFREVLPGWQALSGGIAPTVFANPVYLNSGSRYFNITGNLLGRSGFHTTYSCIGPSTSGSCSYDANAPIFSIGYSDQNAATGFCNNAACSAATNDYDLLTETSLMWYDNYDTVNAATMICTAAATPVAGCPSDQRADAFGDTTGTTSTFVGLSSPGTKPASFLASSKPGWFGSIPWPSAGTDVTGGNLLQCTSGTYSGYLVINSSQCSGGTSTSAYAGHANANPAMACALNVMGMPPDGSGGVLSFNPTCYSPVTTAFNCSPPSLTFGTVTQGTTSGAMTSTCTNVSGATLTVTGVTSTGTNSTDFSPSESCSTVTAGSTCVVSGTFTPTSAPTTIETAQFNLAYTGAGASPAVVPVGGTSGGTVVVAPTVFPITFKAVPLPKAPPTPTLTQSSPQSSYVTSAGVSQDGTHFVNSLSMSLTGTNFALSGATCVFDKTSVPCTCGSLTQCVVTVPAAMIPIPTTPTAHTVQISFPAPVVSIPTLQ